MARCAGRQQRERWTAWSFHVSEMEFTNDVSSNTHHSECEWKADGRRMEGYIDDLCLF